MGIAGFIKGIAERRAVESQEFKARSQSLKIDHTIQERQKSANRRELERYYHEREEEMIKKELDKIRHERSKEIWRGKNSILNTPSSVIKNDRPLLKEKNLFVSCDSCLKQEKLFTR